MIRRVGAPGAIAFTDYYSDGPGSKLFRLLDIEKKRRLKKTVKGRIALDLGSGLSTLFPAGIAVDADIELLRRTGKTAVLTDLDGPLPFRDRSVDFVLMADSIEHLRSADRTIAEVRRILADNGILMIFTPPYDSAVWVIAEKCHRFITRRWAGHTAPMTHESLHRLLGRYFSALEISNFNFGLSMGAVASGPIRQSEIEGPVDGKEFFHRSNPDELVETRIDPM